MELDLRDEKMKIIAGTILTLTIIASGTGIAIGRQQEPKKLNYRAAAFGQIAIDTRVQFNGTVTTEFTPKVFEIIAYGDSDHPLIAEFQVPPQIITGDTVHVVGSYYGRSTPLGAAYGPGITNCHATVLKRG